ncbi:MAG: acetate--CoA ligase family protein [Afipia felis]|jgi:acetyl coenzyme A synthetase (ADP forming)-like protein|uniref:Succinyl-CoA synthetase subunit alpha n=2 Tax=Afipia felis TaxID=1035 RepID=A0A380W9T6_AFIFE|nr:acetate--CoA ligase family protein [Afipia felis]EKS28644.1 acetyl coenzyme A synthetase (ADP forming), alpha domain-containing protein [Afipia felis ATCC 53690]MBN9604740.1 acetate--CoA ligase family protein [Afipia felis]SUU77352.1 succinyl-CoA synthetase subunit alpha [Afipia felis]SUU85419.1 succinyl-CoA synthetase subunit alpha [Afipia felis]
MAIDKASVRKVLDKVKADGRDSLTAPEGKLVCDAYGIAVPGEGVAKSADEATKLASGMGYPVVMKIVSPDILHKTEAGGVVVGVKDDAAAKAAYDQILANAKKYKADAKIEGIQVQQMLTGGTEVIVGSITDDSFGKLVAFGLGGVLVEVLKDITFRMAPATKEDALSMLDGIQAKEMLHGVRGGDPVNRDALANIIVGVSQLVTDFPEIVELDLNPVFATKKDAIAADVRIVVDFNYKPKPAPRPDSEIVTAMNRIMMPKSVAVIGASAEDGKIGNSVMKNLINGGYKGQIYPVHPKAADILGHKAYKSVKDIPGDVDVAVFAIPAKFVAGALTECGEKKIPGAVLIPSGFAEANEPELQEEIVKIGKKYDIRLMGPNIYGFYYTPANLCATFCTAFDVKGSAALSSQSGGIGMAIIGFSRSAKMGVSAIVGLGNKSDIDEDDLLAFFEQDKNTNVIAMHCEDLKDGRAFANAAKRVSKKKPVIVLKGGRTSAGAKAAASHTGALAGNDKIYEDVFKQAGVIRARSLRQLLEFARGVPLLPTPKGENVLIITGAGGSGVLLSDAVVDNGLSLMTMPADLDAAFRKFIPPFGASGNPVDITGGEPPITYVNTVKLGLTDDRIHSLILGYWHTIVTPPMVFAKNMVQIKNEMKAQGFEKPMVASLAGDVEVEEASEYLYQNGIPAYAYSTELPVEVLGAKYKWARGAGLIK